MIFLELFLSFFKIGLFGFGGGYAMLSLIQGEIVTSKGWVTMGEFTDMVALSQVTPGPIGINAATYCGYMTLHNEGYGHIICFLGSITTTIAVILPSLIIIISLARILTKYMKTPLVQNLFIGLRPAVMGLLIATTLLLLTPENFSTPKINPWQFGVSCFLFLATVIGVWRLKINPIRMICYCGIAGLILLY